MTQGEKHALSLLSPLSACSCDGHLDETGVKERSLLPSLLALVTR